ncbi:UbiD family decarboxylase [Thermoproteus tenax]|uniref:Anhydromevalonate phosphate decarboxylase n=1 Tax=Thermoproteus tenax (strain ATCC 35583 / DSM 2078 / JCM 9277 / NBRC 100435 / Kra 1) TaxID=768679 RepID=G4RKX1_THETK|nr:UbiD family decarboxylase [Thermoproteus tenax]CCC82216.1 decarboxylase [Thermoproteus tenax Kra 1]
MSLQEYISRLNDVKRYRPPYEEFKIAKILKETEAVAVPLFESVGGDFHGTGNLLDSRSKLMRALGVTTDEEAYRKLLDAEENPTNIAVVSSWRDEYKALEDLRSLPCVRYYEKEAAPYITSAVIVARAPDGALNASIHRFTPIGRNKAVIRIVPRHLYSIYNKWRELGRPTPVAVSWGLHPLILLAAASSPPYGVFELGVASKLLGGLKAVELDNGVTAPYLASVIMEGYITDELADEGPYVDVVGTYDQVRKQPVVKIEKIYVLKDSPIVHYLLPAGREHQLLMGFEREAKIWRYVSSVVPKVIKVRLTPGGFGWMHAVISIKKSVEGDAKNAALAAFAAHPSLKHVVVVDEDIDPDDPRDVEWALATRFRADRGLVVVPYARGSTLDPMALNEEGLTFKVAVDATRPLDKDPRLFEKAKIP